MGQPGRVRGGAQLSRVEFWSRDRNRHETVREYFLTVDEIMRPVLGRGGRMFAARLLRSPGKPSKRSMFSKALVLSAAEQETKRKNP